VLFHTGADPSLLERAALAGVELHAVSEEVMHRLTSTVTPQGIVGVAPFADVELDALPQPPACVVVLHEVRDPGNAGTVLRSADAAGATGVVFTSSSVDLYNPKTVRASAGSLFHLPFARSVETNDAVDALRQRGCRVHAMAADGEHDLYHLDLTQPTAFLFGNEAHGLPRDMEALADATVRVPIPGKAESLNLAAAATVCLFEWVRQQQEGRRAALETIIASAAHAIRSPLTAMKGFGYALATRWEQMTEDQRSLMLQGIVYDTDRLNTILHQLVDAARLTAGTLDLFPERVAVASVVEQVVKMVARDRPPAGRVGERGRGSVRRPRPAPPRAAGVHRVARVVDERGAGQGLGSIRRRASRPSGVAARHGADARASRHALPATGSGNRGGEQDRPVRRPRDRRGSGRHGYRRDRRRRAVRARGAVAGRRLVGGSREVAC
jgi:TrmH family RNA methyltransferase